MRSTRAINSTYEARRAFGALLCVALLVTLAACGRGDAAEAGDQVSDASSGVAPSAVVQTQQLPADPCALVPRAEMEALFGPLIADPRRVTNNETAESDPEGKACFYEWETPPGELRHFMSLEVEPDAATIETPSGITPSELDSIVPGVDVHAKADSLVDGRWDWLSAGPFGMTVSRGRFSVFAQLGGLDRGKVLELAGRIYDQVSELPFEATPDDWPPPAANQNACALLSREEAEAVLGPLVVAPYASQGGSALASAKGWSCAYYTPGHRALVITPTWSNGEVEFKTMNGVAQMVGRATGGVAAPDTLDGPWDQVSRGMDGSLHILGGDRILTVNYLSSSTDLAGAVKLARMAMTRLSSVTSKP
jgi:hypothetical protein